MLSWELPDPRHRPRVAAVSFLNTVPLVWGMLHGPQQARFELDFCTPAECADRVGAASADIGIVPVVEMSRMGLEPVSSACIASHGAVRSILLVSKVPLSEIRSVAADSSSRTSVMLARVVLAEVYGAEPRFTSRRADLQAMLALSDAALIIGDPALRIDPQALRYQVCDLGQEWTRWTGKPMVFAVWAGRPGLPVEEIAPVFQESAAYGRRNIDAIVAAEAARRGIPEDLAREYLTRHIRFELGDNEREGLALFLEYAAREVNA